jgi:DNA repair protein RecO (recombination protein O)
MEWHDQGIIIGAKKHGETSVILELITRRYGRHLGLVRGGRSRKMQPIIQVGNSIDVIWRARLEDHLGTYQVEPLNLRASHLMANQIGLYGVQTLAHYLRLLPEREPCLHLYEASQVILDYMDNPQVAGELMLRFELAILDDLGFGLDLSQCAATGLRDELIYVSPKSGRAVSREAGTPFAPKLLGLPQFLLPKAVGNPLLTYGHNGQEERQPASAEEIKTGERLCDYFFNRNVYVPRGVAACDNRERFFNAVIKQLKT